MNIKQYKENVEQLAIANIKRLLQEDVGVVAIFNCNENTLRAVITEKHIQKDVVEGILVYDCVLKDGNLTVGAFLRRFISDAHGIAAVVTEPGMVDTNFMSAIAQCLEFSIAQADDKAPASPSASVDSAETAVE